MLGFFLGSNIVDSKVYNSKSFFGMFSLVLQRQCFRAGYSADSGIITCTMVLKSHDFKNVF